MSFLRSLRSELKKSKRTASVYLTIGAAAFGPFMSMLDLAFDGVEGDHKADILNELFTTKFMMTGLVVFPLFLVLVCTLLPQLEYKNNTWKQVLTSPQHKGNVFLAKFVNVQLLVLLFLFTNQALMFVDAVILHLMEPSLHVLSQPLHAGDALLTLANGYVSLLAICAIQFWLGMRFRNFIAPVAIGIALWFVGTILVMQVKAGFVAWFPYSFHAYGKFPKYDPRVNEVGLASAIYALVFLVVGFLDFRRRGMKA
jgi:hypothetical protein